MTDMTYKINKTNKSYTKKGGYENLVVYWLGMTIYDLTVIFCDRYIISLRQKEQMIQAARSGKQDLVEGSLENSVEGNLKLTGIARASYGELTEDYKDFLRQKGLSIWDKNDPRVLEIRRTKDLPYRSYKTYRPYTAYMNSPEEFANLLITLCCKESFLLYRLLQATENKFVREGGFRENLLKKRLAFRQNLI